MSDHTSLGERLGRYSITARGQIARGPSIGEIAGYAAAAGAGLVMAGGADAKIIYSQGGPVASAEIPYAATGQENSFSRFSSGPGGIDIDGDTRDDFNLGVNFAAYYLPGNDDYPNTAAAYVRYSGYGAVVRGSALIEGPTGPELLPGRNLAFGNVIGTAGQSFAAAGGGFRRKQIKNGNVSSDPFGTGAFALSTYSGALVKPASASGFLGIKTSGGYYGWIKLLIQDLGDNQPWTPHRLASGAGYPDKVTVLAWAYQDSGGPIRAGVPVPTPLALLAAGAVGLAAFRRRKLAAVQAD